MKKPLHEEALSGGGTLRLRKDAISISTDALLLSGFLPTLPKERALEIGAGAGTVSVLCALRRKFLHIDAVEIQGELAALARENLQENHLTEAVLLHHADIRSFSPEGRYPLVFSNPPYYKVGGGRAPRSRLSYLSRFEENLTLDELLDAVLRLLTENGRFFLIYPYARRGELLEKAEKRGLFPKRLLPVTKHEGAPPSLLLAVLSRGGGRIPEEHPLSLYTDKSHTAESPCMLRLYEEGILFPEKENL